MTLKLAMIRCPDNVAPQRREVRGGEFSIGRGQDNEWVIPDPDRHLSKKHCLLVYGGGEWSLHDLSTNGTFLNQASEPVGRGAVQKLCNGDRIKFGLYEIEITIDEEEEAAHSSLTPRADRSFNERDDDVRPVSSDPFLDTPASPLLPPDFDPLRDSAEPFSGVPTQPDHAPALESAFRMPPVAIIPDDWDVEAPAVRRPQSVVSNAPAPAPKERRPKEETPSAPPPRPEPPVARTADDARLAAAFLRGGGLPEGSLTDPEKTLERIGAALRATVTGLRQTLIARASIKDEFRIEQTMIRPTGNNPLKFSLDDDDALATLLGEGRRGSMAPEAAIAEAFADLRIHELATISAMQTAVRVLLAQFDPESVERKVATSALHIHPAQRKAAAWEAFVQHHRSVTQALSDDFDSVFGKAFARAYEQAIDKLDSEKGST
ncbi:MAG: hypothetical protein ABS83_01180 [Rhodospirillales bacterium SCN 65-16]|nr:MAG: hypothetical protein ABS83_01180 [Rhodospirillales bacterium SCN 65-16]